MDVNIAEGREQYQYALKKGRKQFLTDRYHRVDPYIKSLDSLVNIYECAIVDIGQIDVPAELIVGTVNTDRRTSFASNFMPIIRGESEFSYKWINVCCYHLSDSGIADSPIAYEYLGKFYISEGNKRVSVLKSYGAVFIPCVVKRVMPKDKDSFEGKLYYEFLEYYKLSKLYSIQFKKLGYYKKLQRLMKLDEDYEWSRKDRITLVGFYGRLVSMLKKKKINVYYPDALVVLIEIYGYEFLSEMSDKQLLKAIDAVRTKIIYDKAYTNILAISDEEDDALWNGYNNKYLKQFDLIISAGDLKAEYLEYLVTVSNKPLLYVHGNHDEKYDVNPPEGCICIDDDVYVHDGIRILGLGGSFLYRDNGKYMYSERQMERRIHKLKRKIKKAGGIDIVVAHAPVKGYGDLEDIAHQGFACFVKLIEDYKPKYFFYGHVHTRYSHNYVGYYKLGDTQIINVSDKRSIIY